MITYDSIRPLEWLDGRLKLLDQRLLPDEIRWLSLESGAEVADAIRQMMVRGAPAIGIAAAYGIVLAARAAWRDAGTDWREAIKPDLTLLAAARPTAVSLQWALERMRGRFSRIEGDPEPVLLTEAQAIHAEDIAGNRQMGELGARLLGQCGAVLTHCNTGSLATGGFGTALGVIRAAYARGGLRRVYATETRPWLQGARLTVWELRQDGIPVTLIADGAAAYLMRLGRVSWVVVGADRIAANGDVANKIGTYALAVSARRHQIGFMVVAPTATIDPDTATGEDIPIEDRGSAEIISLGGRPLAPEGTEAFNPVFDVTPAELVDVLVTERGVLRDPDRRAIESLLRGN